MTSVLHSAAVVARVTGSGSTTLATHDSKPTAPTYPYVVVYFDGGVASSDREADERIQRYFTWQTTTVGTSADQCRKALDRVMARLENWTPTVTGWAPKKVTHESSQPIRPDESLPDRVVYYATDQWSVASDPT